MNKKRMYCNDYFLSILYLINVSNKKPLNFRLEGFFYANATIKAIKARPAKTYSVITNEYMFLSLFFL